MILAAPSGFLINTSAFTSAWSSHLRPKALSVPGQVRVMIISRLILMIQCNSCSRWKVIKFPTVFLQDWSIQHVTGIPHSSTAQAIVESVHGTLKAMLNKQKRGNPMGSVTPQEQLMYLIFKIVLMINYLQQQLTVNSGWSLHLWFDQKYGIKNLGNHNGQVL